jgi:hypothetical protein
LDFELGAASRGAFQIVALLRTQMTQMAQIFIDFFSCENLHHLRHLRFNHPELMQQFEMHSQ